MKNKTPEMMTIYHDLEQALNNGLHELGYYRQKELETNLFYNVEIFSNMLKRFDQLQVELLYPQRNDQYIVGIEIKNTNATFHFRATMTIENLDGKLTTQLHYYSNSLLYNKPKTKSIPFQNHDLFPQDCVNALNQVFLEDLKLAQ